VSGKGRTAAVVGVASFVAAVIAVAANMATVVDFFDGDSTPPATHTVTAVGEANNTPPTDEPEPPAEPEPEPEPSGTGVPEEFQGTWQGTIYQDGYPPYPIEVAITSGSVGADVAEVRYPGQGCGGVWNLRDASDDSLQVVEELSYGVGICVDEVTIDVSLQPDGTMHLAVDYPASTGILCRC
jgi:hypothetical protein